MKQPKTHKYANTIYTLTDVIRQLIEGKISPEEPRIVPGTVDRSKTVVYTETIISDKYKITIEQL